MKRIMIFGFSGSGKSTLAAELGKITGISPVHLDAVHWLPGWVEETRENEIEKLRPVLEKDCWIIDGNYGRVLWEERLEKADTVIFLDVNRFTSFKNAFLRSRRYKNKTRPDMGEGCNEKFDLEFMYWILYEGRTKRNRYMEAVKKASLAGKEVHVFKNVNETNKWLKGLI